MKVNLWIVWDMTKTPPAPVMGKKTRALAREWANWLWFPKPYKITCGKVEVPHG